MRCFTVRPSADLMTHQYSAAARVVKKIGRLENAENCGTSRILPGTNFGRNSSQFHTRQSRQNEEPAGRGTEGDGLAASGTCQPL